MKVYVVLHKLDNSFNYDAFKYDYCGVSATLNHAKEILQEIIDGIYENCDINNYEEQDYATYWVYMIDNMQFEIWEEVI